MACALPAVDVQDLAGDKCSAVQVEDRLNDVVDLTHMADRVQLAQGIVSFGGVHRGFDDARRHGVGADASLGILNGD